MTRRGFHVRHGFHAHVKHHRRGYHVHVKHPSHRHFRMSAAARARLARKMRGRHFKIKHRRKVAHRHKTTRHIHRRAGLHHTHRTTRATTRRTGVSRRHGTSTRRGPHRERIYPSRFKHGRRKLHSRFVHGKRIRGVKSPFVAGRRHLKHWK